MIDIPESLYRRAQILASETGSSVRELVLTALTHELENCRDEARDTGVSYFATRKLLPEYQAALHAGAFKGGTDSAQIISEERGA